MPVSYENEDREERDKNRQPLLKPPSLQDKLEETDPASKIFTEVDKLIQGSLSDEQHAFNKKLYMCFLRATEIYEEQSQKRLGIRRKRHLTDLIKGQQSAPSGAGQSLFSGNSSFSVLSSDPSQSLLTSDLATQGKLKPPPSTSQKGKK